MNYHGSPYKSGLNNVCKLEDAIWLQLKILVSITYLNEFANFFFHFAFASRYSSVSFFAHDFLCCI